jgi:hypothetical protein
MHVRQIEQVDNNKFYVIGGMEAGQAVTNKVSVFVVDSVITGLEKETPDGLNMEIGPNPIQLEDCLKIRLPQGTPMRLRVVDALGHTLADWQSEGGEMEFCPGDWGMVSGVYFLSAEGEDGMVVRRVVLR